MNDASRAPDPQAPTSTNSEPVIHRWRFDRDPWMAHLDHERPVSTDAVLALRAWAASDARRSFSVTAGFGKANSLDATLHTAASDEGSNRDLGRLVVRYGLTRRKLYP